jgi:ABC-type histidine transport system ATPase subunit
MTGASQSRLEIVDLRKRYGETTALAGISLDGARAPQLAWVPGGDSG